MTTKSIGVLAIVVATLLQSQTVEIGYAQKQDGPPEPAVQFDFRNEIKESEHQPAALGPEVDPEPHTILGIAEFEGNDTPATAMFLSFSPIAIVTGAINPGGDVDYFYFTAAAGSRVWIGADTGGVQNAGFTTRDSVIDLLAADTTTVIENDDDDGTGNGGDGSVETGVASMIAGRTLAAGGTYYVRVREFNGTGIINPYRLFVYVSGVAATAEIEANNTAATATVANSPSLRSASISVAADADYYSVSANAGDTIVFQADADPERDGTGTDLVVELRDPADVLLLSVDSSIAGSVGNPAAEGANFTVATSGTYFIKVRHFSATGTGTYHLMVVKAFAVSSALKISEFRVRGPGGAADEFVEIVNNSASAHTVSSNVGTGYSVVASDGAIRCTIPNGTTIPAGGHFLCTNSVAYSLGAYVAGDATYTTDIPDNYGIALFNNNVPANFIPANRFDAVGSTAEANTLYKEGTGYPPLTPFSIDYSFSRRPNGGCIGSNVAPCDSVALIETTAGPVNSALVDNNNNAAEFIFVDTNGTSAGAGQRLGAPGPQNLSSPVSIDGFGVTVSKFDASRPYNTPPNVVRDYTSNPGQNAFFGTADYRARFTNNTGGSITRLRFRVIDITTFPSASGVADLRPFTSSDITVSGATVRGTTLEQPPSQPNGSGFNGTLSVGAITPGTPLANGTSVNVRFLSGIQQPGAARFCVQTETLPVATSQVFCFTGPTDGVIRDRSVATFQNTANIVIPATGTGGSSGSPATPYPSSIVVAGVTAPVSRVSVRLKQINHTFPGDVDVLLVGPTGVKFLLMSDAIGNPDLVGQTYTFDDRAMAILPSASTGSPPPTGSYKPTNHSSGDAFPPPAPGTPYVSPGPAGTSSLGQAFGGLNPNGTWSLYVVDDQGVDIGNFAGGWDITFISSCVASVEAVASDFNGDCVSDNAVFRPSTGTWFTPGQAPVQFGLPGDVPMAGDYNGDGLVDRAVYRPSDGTWFVHNQAPVQFGSPGDIPVPGDYTGDGMTDRAVYRRSNGTWYVQNQAPVQWGLPGDIPVPGDYHGDGVMDFAVYRPSTGTWFVYGQAGVQFGLPGDIPVPADYNGGGTTDIAVYRPSTGTWFLRGLTTEQWGLAGDIPAPADFDGDAEADLAVYRPSTGTWFIKTSSSNYASSTTVSFGLPGDIPIPNSPVAYVVALRSTLATQSRVSDFDGDRLSDLTVFRPSSATWFTRQSTTDYATSVSVQWGLSGDVPVPGDYDGDGQTDFAVYRPSTAGWHFLRSSSNYTASTSVSWGLSGDVAVPGDYDGDGFNDPAVYRPASGEWFILRSSSGYTVFQQVQWGLSGDVPMTGTDFDGDAISDLTVYRPSTGIWLTKFSSTGYVSSASHQFGLSGDIPVPGEYDGDGVTDRTVYRPSNGTWYILHSSTNLATTSNVQWGLSTDVPVPGDFDGDRRTDVAVWRPSSATWFILLSSTNFTVFDQIQWGLSSDIPILKRP